MEIITTIFMWTLASFAITAAVGLLALGGGNLFIKITNKVKKHPGVKTNSVDLVSYVPLYGIVIAAFLAWIELYTWDVFYDFLMYGAIWFLLLSPVYFREKVVAES